MLATYVLFYLMTNFTLSTARRRLDARRRAGGRRGRGQAVRSAARAVLPGLGFGYTDFVLMQIIGVVFFGIFTLLSGPIADTIGRRTAADLGHRTHHRLRAAFNLFLLPQADPKFTGALVQAFLIFGFMLMGTTFGPMGAVLPELFPTNVRYSGSAIAYNVSSILGAALAPIIAVALWARTVAPWLVGLYLLGAGVLTLIAVMLGKETKDIDYAAVSADDAATGRGAETVSV